MLRSPSLAVMADFITCSADEVLSSVGTGAAVAAPTSFQYHLQQFHPFWWWFDGGNRNACLVKRYRQAFIQPPTPANIPATVRAATGNIGWSKSSTAGAVATPSSGQIINNFQRHLQRRVTAEHRPLSHSLPIPAHGRCAWAAKSVKAFKPRLARHLELEQ